MTAAFSHMAFLGFLTPVALPLCERVIGRQAPGEREPGPKCVAHRLGEAANYDDDLEAGPVWAAPAPATEP